MVEHIENLNFLRVAASKTRSNWHDIGFLLIGKPSFWASSCINDAGARARANWECSQIFRLDRRSCSSWIKQPVFILLVVFNDWSKSFEKKTPHWYFPTTKQETTSKKKKFIKSSLITMIFYGLFSFVISRKNYDIPKARSLKRWKSNI